jgi:hypothetical protein
MSECNNATDGKDEQTIDPTFEYAGHTWTSDSTEDFSNDLPWNYGVYWFDSMNINGQTHNRKDPIVRVLMFEDAADGVSREVYTELTDLYLEKVRERLQEVDRWIPNTVDNEREDAFHAMLEELEVDHELESDIITALRHVIHFHDIDVDVVEYYKYLHGTPAYYERYSSEELSEMSPSERNEALEQVKQDVVDLSNVPEFE